MLRNMICKCQVELRSLMRKVGGTYCCPDIDALPNAVHINHVVVVIVVVIRGPGNTHGMLAAVLKAAVGLEAPGACEIAVN